MSLPGKGRKRRGGMIKLLIVDDDRLVTSALARTLAHRQYFQVGVAGDAGEALAMARQTQPDVVLLDIVMPGRSCFEVAPLILKMPSRPKVIFVSGYLHPRQVCRALDSGAHGYILKNELLDSLEEAVLRIHQGERYFSPEVQRVAAGLGLFGFDRPARDTALTCREREVLQRIAAGRSHDETATTLGLSRITVRKRWESAMAKLRLEAFPAGMMTRAPPGRRAGLE